jgi:hypothetical protein
MGAPTVYKSTDDNAPVMNGIAGSLINLLRKCLVDGFGTKAGAGWTLEFLNTAETIAVFRNDSVNGFGKYFRIDDTYGTYAKIAAYETMSDIDTGSGRIPGGDSSSTVYYIVKSVSASTVSRPWIAVADNRSIWFIPYAGETALSGTSYIGAACFLGDGIPQDTSDSYFGGIVAPPSSGYNTDNFPHNYTAGNSSVAGCCLFRDYTGTNKAVQFGCMGGGLVGNPPGLYGISGAVNGQYQFFMPEVIISTQTYRIFGRLPGLYFSSHHYSTFTTLQEISEGTHNLLAVRSFVTAGEAQFFVDISENYRP